MHPSIAYIISSHGYGHAARAAAVISALAEHRPDLSFHIFTQVNPAFFEVSHLGNYQYHSEWTDVGLVQAGPFTEDLSATAGLLAKFLSQAPQTIQRIKTEIQNQDCQLVICDISPIGITAAVEAKVPAFLVENFTWDWIYAGYPQWRSQLNPAIQVLGDWFRSASCHIQTTPVCAPNPTADLVTSPVSRKNQNSRAEIRSLLKIPQDAKTVLITTGGIENRPVFMDQLGQHRDAYFLVPGGSNDGLRIEGNVIAFPHQSNLYHPDLVQASDLVIGKAGYSTIAEVYHAGIPFGYVLRANFPETAPLVEYIQQEIPGGEIPAEEFNTGAWLEKLDFFLSLPRVARTSPNGADQIADFILEQLRQ